MREVGDLASPAAMIALAAIAGVGVPWVGMRLVVRTLVRRGATVPNYRGVPVVTGLGFVWVLWSAGVAIFLSGLAVHAAISGAEPPAEVATLLGVALPLVAGAFLFGYLDDTYGTAAEKGFRGHLGALREGRVTTGCLKALGIGALSLLGGGWIAVQAWDGSLVRVLAHTIVAAAVLGLASNTLNLFDLRPGRALKFYVFLVSAVLAAVAVRIASVGLGSDHDPFWLSERMALLVLFYAGPVLAVWRFDLGEVGMLGDAGANGLGMLAGVVMVAMLPPGWLTVPLVALLALNLASERVSFSAVIEHSRALSAIDGWGRLPNHRSGGGGR